MVPPGMTFTYQEIWDGFSDIFLFGVLTSEEGRKRSRRQFEFKKQLSQRIRDENRRKRRLNFTET